VPDLFACVRLCNECLEGIMPPLGECFVAQEHDTCTNRVLWTMSGAPATGVRSVEEFVIDQNFAESPHDVWFLYRRACLHVFASRLLAKFLDGHKGRLLAGEHAVKRVGVVYVQPTLSVNVCPRLSHAETGDQAADSVVYPIYGKHVKFLMDYKNVTYRHCFVVLEIDDAACESPYVYVDLCPSRLGAASYDDAEPALPMLAFRATDDATDTNAPHFLVLAQQAPLVYWCDDAAAWPRLAADMDEPPSPLAECHGIDGGDDVLLDKCLDELHAIYASFSPPPVEMRAD
jgi:hypothetical protein